MNEQCTDVPQRSAEPLRAGQVAFDDFDVAREVSAGRVAHNGPHLLASLDEMLDQWEPDRARRAGDNNHDNFLPWWVLLIAGLKLSIPYADYHYL
jgi:hypothetical protein